MASRTEFWLGLATFAGVLLIDVLEGMIVGLVASLLLVIYKSSRPHVSSLGRTPGRADLYGDLGRHPENLAVPGVLVVRPDGPLYYASALTVRSRINELVVERQETLRAVVLDMETQDELDVTTAEVLEGLVKELRGKKLQVYAAAMHAPVREFAQRTGLLEELGEAAIFPSLNDAVSHAERFEPTAVPA
jgi:SulP family sulfate permease